MVLELGQTVWTPSWRHRELLGVGQNLDTFCDQSDVVCVSSHRKKDVMRKSWVFPPYVESWVSFLETHSILWSYFSIMYFIPCGSCPLAPAGHWPPAPSLCPPSIAGCISFSHRHTRCISFSHRHTRTSCYYCKGLWRASSVSLPLPNPMMWPHSHDLI